MKKILLSIFVGLSSIVMAQQSTQKQEMEVTMTGHMGRQPDCLGGLGFCSINSGTAKGEGFKNFFAVKTGVKSFQLIIKRKEWTKEEEKELTGKTLQLGSSTQFVMEHDLILDEDTLTSMGLNPVYNTITAGSYPMVVNKAQIIISVTLAKP